MRCWTAERSEYSFRRATTLDKLGRTENEVATHILMREVYCDDRSRLPRDAHAAAFRMRAGEGIPAPGALLQVARKSKAKCGRSDEVYPGCRFTHPGYSLEAE